MRVNGRRNSLASRRRRACSPRCDGVEVVGVYGMPRQIPSLVCTSIMGWCVACCAACARSWRGWTPTCSRGVYMSHGIPYVHVYTYDRDVDTWYTPPMPTSTRRTGSTPTWWCARTVGIVLDSCGPRSPIRVSAGAPGLAVRVQRLLPEQHRVRDQWSHPISVPAPWRLHMR